MSIDNNSAPVRQLFRAIKKGDVVAARGVLRQAPYLVHARTGSGHTDTPLLTAVMAGDKAMTRMLLDEGSPIFSIEGERGRVPIQQALSGGVPGMLEVFVDHAGGIEAIVDSSLSKGKLSWMMRSLVSGSLPTKLHEDILLAALEPVGQGSWPRHSDFTCIQWPWSEAHNWSDPSDDFISRLEQATIPFPDNLLKMGEVATGSYSAEDAWLNTMVNLVKSRSNQFSSRWLALTADDFWIKPLPERPSMKGPRQPFAENLVELCARSGHLMGLKLGLDAVGRLKADEWVHANRKNLFLMASGGRNPGASPSVSCIRMLDKRIGMGGLSSSSRQDILEVLLATDYEPGLRAKAIRIFLQGPDTLPPPDRLLDITRWNPKSSKAIASVVLAMGDNGFDLHRDIQDHESIIDLLNRSHPEAAAIVSSSMMSSTPKAGQERRSRPRL